MPKDNYKTSKLRDNCVTNSRKPLKNKRPKNIQKFQQKEIKYKKFFACVER